MAHLRIIHRRSCLLQENLAPQIHNATPLKSDLPLQIVHSFWITWRPRAEICSVSLVRMFARRFAVRLPTIFNIFIFPMSMFLIRKCPHSGRKSERRRVYGSHNISTYFCVCFLRQNSTGVKYLRSRFAITPASQKWTHNLLFTSSFEALL